jgi:hypothetical protein
MAITEESSIIAPAIVRSLTASSSRSSMPLGRTRLAHKSIYSFHAGARSSLLVLGEQLGDGYPERIGKALNDGDRRVALAAFDAADICPVNTKL